MTSIFRRFDKNCSSFRRVDSVPNSNIELNMPESTTNTPEKCLSPLNYKWKSVNNVIKVKHVKSISNMNSENSEKILNCREKEIVDDKPRSTSKFTKRYLKMKLSKLFRSNSKSNVQSKDKTSKTSSEILCDSCTNAKSQTCIPMHVSTDNDSVNDALRNLSFTAAMMTKSSGFLSNSPEDDESIEHTKQIPSSALRFWKKPSEEKLKASQRRIQDNLLGSNEVLLRIIPSLENIKHPSELSLFYEEGNYHQELIKLSNSDMRSTVIVPGYDKALSRYQNIINQSKHYSRKDRALSLAYDTETNIPYHRSEMTSSQSSNNMTSLARSNSVVQGFNPDRKTSSPCEIERSPSLQGKYFIKDRSYNTLSKTQISNVQNTLPLQPPPYDNNLLNKRFVKMKMSSKPSSSSKEKELTFRSKKSESSYIQKAPKPPPRGDSLIRSFELICQNLTISISQPRGDSFKMFKSQRDYENWLKNLPYNNPEKIAELLKMRSKIARRQCVSELIDVHMVNMDNDKRRHSWPLINNANISFENSSNRRASSLSRVKKKKETKDSSKSLDSPSLCNYRRLYSLRNSETGNSVKQTQQDKSLNVSTTQTSLRSPLSSQIKRPFKYRYRQINNINTRMTESCHESNSHSMI